MKKNLFAATAMLLVACTPDLPWRVKDDGSLGEVHPKIEPPPTIEEAGQYRNATIETYRVPPKENGSAVPENISVGVVEFTKDGSLWFSEQGRAIVKHIRERADGPAGVTVIVFTPGWHHGGSVCDREISCFRKVLAGLALAEAEFYTDAPHNTIPRKRPVVGVYLSWRGESTPKLSFLSFYNRGMAAHEIGGSPTWSDTVFGSPRKSLNYETAAGDLLTQLDEIYQDANKDTYKMSLLTVGHSFGGALTFSAVRKRMERQIRKKRNSGTLLTGIGDLVVLVNPAFEARQYDEFAKAVEAKNFHPDQGPLLMVVQSTADGWNNWAFTVGRTFTAWMWLTNNLPRHFLSSRRTLGYYGPYRTHKLKVKGNPEIRKEDPHPKRCTCPWPLDEVTIANSIVDKASGKVPENEYGGVILERGEYVDARTPYLVVSTDEKLIPDHSAIFTKPFINFLLAFVTETRAKRRKLLDERKKDAADSAEMSASRVGERK